MKANFIFAVLFLFSFGASAGTGPYSGSTAEGEIIGQALKESNNETSYFIYEKISFDNWAQIYTESKNETCSLKLTSNFGVLTSTNASVSCIPRQSTAYWPSSVFYESLERNEYEKIRKKIITILNKNGYNDSFYAPLEMWSRTEADGSKIKFFKILSARYSCDVSLKVYRNGSFDDGNASCNEN